jgi:bacterioferritin (cytochrome b1)
MKEFIKHNPATLDNVETMANAMIESMRFVDNTLDYPEAEKARPNDGVEPEWFYDAYYGAIPTSELTAIIQYTQQRMLFENIGETFLGIAFVEMKHFDRLGDFIGQLGGRVNTPKYSSSAVTVEYESAAEAVRVNIQAEKDTIAAYQQLIERIRKNNPEKLTQSATVAIQLLNKIPTSGCMSVFFRSWRNRSRRKREKRHNPLPDRAGVFGVFCIARNPARREPVLEQSEKEIESPCCESFKI